MITLKAEKREVFGKQVKKLREQGFIPAELYGRGISNIHLSVPVKDFVKLYKEAGEHSVLQVEVDGQPHPVLVHDVFYNPIDQEILAVDFYQVRMDEKVKAHIPLELEGQAPAVDEKEGILIKNMDEIEVEALPTDLPPSIKVDLSGLVELDQSIYVKDLPKSDKFEYVIDPETAVLSVTAPKEEEVEEVPVPAVEGKAAPEEGEPRPDESGREEGRTPAEQTKKKEEESSNEAKT